MIRMIRKIRCIFTILVLCFILGSTLLFAQERNTEKEAMATAMELQGLLRQRQAEGVDITEAIKLDRQSRQAMEQGRPEECLRLLKKAISLLGESKAEEKSQAINYCKEYENSPFGFSGAFSRPFVDSGYLSQEEILRSFFQEKAPYRHVQDLGVKWVRPGADFYWSSIQPTEEHRRRGVFEWAFVDRMYGLVPSAVAILGTIDALPWGVNTHPAFKPGTWEFASEEAERYYIQFVRKVIERYDGDGYKDMPGLKNPIKFWQIGNEPALRPPIGIKDFNRKLDWEGFSHIVEITYKAIKDNDPSTKVALAGLAIGTPPAYAPDPFFKALAQKERDEFFLPLLKKIGGKYIDIFDIHYYGFSGESLEGWDWKGMRDTYNLFRTALNKNGYQNTEIWFTETAMPSRPFGEKIQATNLFKRYIYPLSFGVKKIFWWNMIEGEGPDLENENKPSNHYGPVYDGIGKDDPGYGVKKLSYYTYKKMTEILEGSDWDNIQTIQESGGIYIYKFIKPFDFAQGKPIWVAWNDNKEEREIIISGISSSKVKVTEAVPKYASGKEVEDYNAAFNTETKSVQDGKVNITLKNVPLFVEEQYE